MHIAASPLGPAVLIEARIGLAALTLLVISYYLKKTLKFLTSARHFFALGLFNIALPFLLLAYSAQTLNASTLSILNSTAPIWGSIIATLWTKIPLTRSVLIV